MSKFSIKKTIKNIEDYAEGKYYLNTQKILKDKPFFDIFKTHREAEIDYLTKKIVKDLAEGKIKFVQNNEKR